MKTFSVRCLKEAIDLYEHVETNRWAMPNLKKDDQQLYCAFWTFKARELLERPHLSEADKEACIWALGVARAISAQGGFYVYGLSRDHSANWSERALLTEARMTRREERRALKPPAQAKVQTAPRSRPEPEGAFPGLVGTTIVVVGGELDSVLLERFHGADFTLVWAPGNIRQVQAAVERIKLRKVDGVIFLTDLNRHANFFLVRDACRLSSVPMVCGTKGLAGVKKALGQLNAQIARLPRSA